MAFYFGRFFKENRTPQGTRIKKTTPTFQIGVVEF